MKKKILSFLMSLAMVFGVFSYAPVSFAAENTAYGEYAYSVLQYLDKNLNKRIAGTDQEVKTSNYLKEQLESFGYEVKVQEFTYARKGTNYNSQNLIATKKGTSSKEIIIGSHYDSVGTNGVDDNGSGTVVNLETAKRLAKATTPYTIKFVFFGAEEAGCRGSAAYAKAMSQDEIANTIYMVNMDSLLAGTYRYIYSGNYNEETQKVENAWPVEQALKLSDALGTNMRLNNTKLNIDYPTPSTGDWSDHVNFRNIMPYLYFEAVNWELPDDPEKPEEGSSGAYETELGEVMHNPERDNLEFIEKTWGSRGKDTVSAYCKLLEAVVYQLDPDGLKTPSKDELKLAIDNANDMDKDNFSESSYKVFINALKEAKKVNKTEYVLLKDQSIIDNATKKLNDAMAVVSNNIANCKIKVENQVYNGKTQRPDVLVKDGKKELKEGKDYTVSYSKNKEIGTANVTVKGCNDYLGKATATFKILPEKVTNLKASEITSKSFELKWKKVSNATGYKVYKYDTKTKKDVLVATLHKNSINNYKVSKLADASIYKYRVSAYKNIKGEVFEGPKTSRLSVVTKPLKPVVKLSTKSKQVIVDYSQKASNNATGYEVYMSTSKSGSYKLVKETDKKKVTVKKLSNKKYYFKVRAYKKVNGKKVYGDYSSVKSITVK